MDATSIPLSECIGTWTQHRILQTLLWDTRLLPRSHTLAQTPQVDVYFFVLAVFAKQSFHFPSFHNPLSLNLLLSPTSPSIHTSTRLPILDIDTPSCSSPVSSRHLVLCSPLPPQPSSLPAMLSKPTCPTFPVPRSPSSRSRVSRTATARSPPT
jgi:hypothetical protein